MATNTSKYKLRKPAVTDQVDVVQDISDNMDKIDSLALMNRPAWNSDPAVVWSTTMYGNQKYLEFDTPINFKQQIYPYTFDGNSTADIGQWRAICKCAINADTSTSITSTFLFTAGNPLLSGATRGGGIFSVFQRTPESGAAQSQLEFRWLCGDNINVNDYAVGVRAETGDDGTTKYFICLYFRKKSTYDTHVLTCLEFHRNYTFSQSAYITTWQDITSEAGIDASALPSRIVYSQPPSGFITG